MRTIIGYIKNMLHIGAMNKLERGQRIKRHQLRFDVTHPIPVKIFMTSIDCNIPINPGTGPKTPLSLQLLHPSVGLIFGYKHR